MWFLILLVLFTLAFLLLRIKRHFRLRRRWENWTVEESLATMAGRPMYKGRRWPRDTSTRV